MLRNMRVWGSMRHMAGSGFRGRLFFPVDISLGFLYTPLYERQASLVNGVEVVAILPRLQTSVLFERQPVVH